MQLTLINPNISQSVTDVMLREARRVASPGIEIEGVTADFGSQYIENRIEASIAAHAVLEVIAGHWDTTDAFIISAFGDPGLLAAREYAAVPVVALEESALLVARTLGTRVSIVAPTPRLAAWFAETAEQWGLADCVVSCEAQGQSVVDIETARETLRDSILEASLDAVRTHRAEVVIIGGGPVAGIAHEIEAEVPVPVIDGVSCAVLMAELLVRLGPRPPTTGTFATPARKLWRGVSDKLPGRLGSD
jgi:Asp/Glu/hydantoin racemase